MTVLKRSLCLLFTVQKLNYTSFVQFSARTEQTVFRSRHTMATTRYSNIYLVILPLLVRPHQEEEEISPVRFITQSLPLPLQ